jgi:ABC-type nickel/cobalt efflux system permease component RcnA
MTFEQISNTLLEWIIRGAGLLWLVGAFMLFRQIRGEMALDKLTTSLEARAREIEAEAGETPDPISARDPHEAWADRDDAARRGWIAAQAVVLAATALAMLLLHPFAVWMVALLVAGQGAYFFWREHTARRAPTAEAAEHARPSTSTVNAGWMSLAVAILVGLAAWRGLLH